MGTVRVRVVPRSGQRDLQVTVEGVRIRVRAAPEGGRATQEARRVLAEALGVPRSRVRLRTGERSRTKVFEIEGLSTEAAERRLR